MGKQNRTQRGEARKGENHSPRPTHPCTQTRNPKGAPPNTTPGERNSTPAARRHQAACPPKPLQPLQFSGPTSSRPPVAMPLLLIVATFMFLLQAVAQRENATCVGVSALVRRTRLQ